MSFIKKRSFAVCLAAGEVCALALTVLTLLPMAWAVHAEALDQRFQWPCCLLTAALSVFIPTLLLARARGRQALITGGALALGYVLSSALLCALGGEKCAFGMWLAALTGAAAAGGLAAALLGVRRNRHKKRRH